MYKQIINHGIPDVVIRRMLEVAEEFFRMPVEDRMEYYSDDPFNKIIERPRNRWTPL
jgi:isopenicillin N synthase-like dioxygenase